MDVIAQLFVAMITLLATGMVIIGIYNWWQRVRPDLPDKRAADPVPAQSQAADRHPAPQSEPVREPVRPRPELVPMTDLDITTVVTSAAKRRPTALRDALIIAPGDQDGYWLSANQAAGLIGGSKEKALATIRELRTKRSTPTIRQWNRTKDMP